MIKVVYLAGELKWYAAYCWLWENPRYEDHFEVSCSSLAKIDEDSERMELSLRAVGVIEESS